MAAIMATNSKFENYQLGIDDIDEQHRALFNYIENLDTAIASGDRWLVVYQTLVELENWAKVHFAVEESLMRICRFPHLEKHIRQHGIFVAEVGQMKEETQTREISQKASKFLHSWLLQHIGVDDRKYAEYFLTLNQHLAHERG